jgi:hypothetical protein
MNRYFVTRDGEKTLQSGRPGGSHVDIGREVLAELGVTAKDGFDVYEQMFRREFVRVVEHANGRLEVEFRGKLTPAQTRFVENMEQQGWKLQLLETRRELDVGFDP